MLKITNYKPFGDRHLKGEKRIFRKIQLLGQFSANNLSMLPEMVKNDFFDTCRHACKPYVLSTLGITLNFRFI